MDNKKYNIFVLPNGLKCVHLRTNGKVSYCGVAVNAGSRDEPAGNDGLAHFVEHTIFKGTTHRKSWHISNRMERVGGELNAYTSKEETLIYTNSPAGYVERAMELLSDLITYSIFPEEEINKEREVVIDEINSYLDSPCDSVFDEFEELIYKGSRMEHNILGDPESVRNLKSKNCRDFIDKFYTPLNMAVYCVDPSPSDKIERITAKYFSHLKFPKAKSGRITPVFAAQFNECRNRNGHQAHTITGSRVFDRNDPRRFALFLLNNHLGGPCMNSRLNMELREKRGYVYTVDSSVSLMSDCGTMQIYFGCDAHNVKACLKHIGHELEKLANDTIKPRLFDQIKTQYLGQLSVSTDHKEASAMSLGKSLLYYGKVLDIDSTSKRIKEVTAEQVRDVAQLILSNGCSTLTLY